MKAWSRLSAAVIGVLLILTAVLNIVLIKAGEKNDGLYRVEAGRLAREIETTGGWELSGYPHLTGVFPDSGQGLYSSDEHYLIIEARGRLYRVEYELTDDRSVLVTADLIMAGVIAAVVLMLIYIKHQIITPFGRLNKVPEELARGNLAVAIPEEKSRFFGRFTWGINLLRETIEESRRKELTMQKDKKLLLLSLSHDIKTPLSAIKLNAKALARGLYKDEEKRREAAESISARADEIESFVSQITKASSEDFMSFEVTEGEEFLRTVIDKVKARYEEQLALSGTEFVIGSYNNYLLSCDPDRLGECLQNLVENAMKYGDGRRIELRFEMMDGCELITVSNTGCTLKETELTQIFSSFQRGTNAGNSPGNGLGLFICKRLMSLMGGEVYAEIKDGCFEATLVVRLA